MSVRLDHGEDSLTDIHEINVTPFIDVMLVLLIIFMVAAPLATVDIAVNLPTAAAQAQPRPPMPQFLTVKADSRWPSATNRLSGTHSARHSTPRPKATGMRAFSCAPTRASPTATSWR
jgi:biopolymer transport protein ExbD